MVPVIGTILLTFLAVFLAGSLLSKDSVQSPNPTQFGGDVPRSDLDALLFLILISGIKRL